MTRAQLVVCLIGALLTGIGNAMAAEGMDAAECSSQPPWEIDESVLSPDGSVTVTHYIMKTDNYHKDIWPGIKSCLQVSESGSSWWVQRLMPQMRMTDIIFRLGEFVDESHLFVTGVGITASSLYLLDLSTRELKYLGGGEGAKFITHGPNKGLVLLGTQKRYRVGGGAYWINVLVNLDGELIEFIPMKGRGPAFPCFKVADILRETEPRSKLRQALDECVAVER